MGEGEVTTAREPITKDDGEVNSYTVGEMKNGYRM